MLLSNSFFDHGSPIDLPTFRFGWFGASFRHLLAQLELTDDGLELRLVHHGREPPVATNIISFVCDLASYTALVEDVCSDQSAAYLCSTVLTRVFSLMLALKLKLEPISCRYIQV